MNQFEKRYIIDNSREADGPREKHYTIELSDRDHKAKLEVMNPKPHNAQLVYRAPLEGNFPNEKKELAEKITKETKVIKLNEKNKSKSPKKKSRKNNSPSNTTAVASIQS